MGFSGVLTLTDLNDFITPSQSCIKPVEKLNQPDTATTAAGPTTTIQVDRVTGSYFEVQTALSSDSQPQPQAQKLAHAQVNLNDCLACSGCITSAEEVLITLQSHLEVLTFLESNKLKRIISTSQTENSGPNYDRYKIPVISISPQSLASLAAAIGAVDPTSSPLNSTTDSYIPTLLPPSSRTPTSRQILHRVRAFCTQALGFSHVFDTTFARHLALREHAAEFIDRRRHATAMSVQQRDFLPMLASACPGWICYTEKTHPEMLPFIARTKSPQQVMGTLVKHWMGQLWNVSPDEIYHVTVMPCYDKKLEASRTDFYNEMYSTRDVDCVLTTGELELLMTEKNWDLSSPVPGELDNETFLDDGAISATLSLPELISHPGTSSGSYLHAIVAHLRGIDPDPDSLELRVKAIRGSDYEEYELVRQRRRQRDLKSGPDGNMDVGTIVVVEDEEEIVFRGAKCYGFRNLQNVIRRLGKEKGLQTTKGAAGRSGTAARRMAAGRGRKAEASANRECDYVEVMACPGGCVNGGGQLKPVAGNDKDKEGSVQVKVGNGVIADTGEEKENGVENQTMRWGSKEWTLRVEDEYWRGEHSEDELRTVWADELAAEVVAELCGSAADGEGEEFERLRRSYLRTEYRAVESEVIGLGVVW